MIVLTSSDTLQIKLGGAVTTDQPEFVATWADEGAIPMIGRSLGETNSATAVPLVAGPAASYQRVIRAIQLHNTDTVAVDITVQLTDGVDTRILHTVTVGAGGNYWFDGGEWGPEPNIFAVASSLSLVATTGEYGDLLSLPTLGTAATTAAADYATAAQGALAATAIQPGGGITLGTPVATTSGTAIDFTGIPAWVKRITVMFQGVSTNGTSLVVIRIGDSGGIESTDYEATSGVVSSLGYDTANSTTGFNIDISAIAARTYSGAITLSLVDASTNTWVQSGIVRAGASRCTMSAGHKSLSATLDRVQLTTVGGTDTFDLGTLNISYE